MMEYCFRIRKRAMLNLRTRLSLNVSDAGANPEKHYRQKISLVSKQLLYDLSSHNLFKVIQILFSFFICIFIIIFFFIDTTRSNTCVFDCLSLSWINVGLGLIYLFLFLIFFFLLFFPYYVCTVKRSDGKTMKRLYQEACVLKIATLFGMGSGRRGKRTVPSASRFFDSARLTTAFESWPRHCSEMNGTFLESHRA